MASISGIGSGGMIRGHLRLPTPVGRAPDPADLARRRDAAAVESLREDLRMLHRILVRLRDRGVASRPEGGAAARAESTGPLDLAGTATAATLRSTE